MNTSRLRILIFMVLDWKKTIFEKLKCLQSYIKLFFKSKNNRVSMSNSLNPNDFRHLVQRNNTNYQNAGHD